MNGYCRYLYDISLQRARGYGVLKALVAGLAERFANAEDLAVLARLEH